ncbi:MAG TPA: hypothetical protein PLF13_03785 [candidate division Zixibacteria bacterium]|mgnify:CR=1 FL=1|nr:hypothetical protein [candidate division Zixibacteria bacterium]
MDLLNLLAQSQTNSSYPLPDLNRLAESGLSRQTEQTDETTSTPETTDSYVPSSASDSDSTYRFEREARLDYSMTLQFNLSSFSRTVARIANGDMQALEEYAAASFGLTADMSFEGYQQIREYSDVSDQSSSLRRSSQSVTSNFSSRSDWQNRQYQVRNFLSEASEVRRGLSLQVQNGHRSATNNLAARYRLDTSMSLKYMNAFNKQTTRLAESAPESLSDYFNTTASVAESAPIDILSGFFEATEEYLDAAEQSLTTQATEYFDMAVEELGFDGELVDMAREQLVDSVTGFFDRVDTAIDQIENFYSSRSDSSGLLADRFAGAGQSPGSSYLTYA